jgi:hypothetical protein
MKTSRTTIVAATLLAGATATFAAGMDTNGDGMVSKQEYISHHEAMFDKMDKGGKGMVPVKDMDRATRAETMKSNERARKGEGAATPAPANK